MDTGRVNKRFYHLATLKHTGSYDAGGFLVVRSAYLQYGDKAEGLWTGLDGRADFLADSGCVTIWLEDGVGFELMRNVVAARRVRATHVAVILISADRV